MKNPFENTGKAFKQFEEPFEWRMDAKPHTRGVLRGVLLQGTQDSQSAGNSLAPITANVYTIHVTEEIKFLCDIKIGDTLKPFLHDENILTIQDLYHDMSTNSIFIICTSNQRSPM